MSRAILRTLDNIVDALRPHGVHPPSEFWADVTDRFYLHPTARELVACVGRGGDKTRMSVLMSMAEVLSGTFVVAAGERHYYCHVSENVGEATKTLGILENYLGFLRVPYVRRGDTIDLKRLPLGWKVLACRVGAVSGFRCVGFTCDEAAKWSSEETGANPCEEVVASIQAMCITHPEARGRMISSPLGQLGFFHKVWSEGDTEDTIVCHAASWVANPDGITEAEAERRGKKSRDPRRYAREYQAIPQSAALAAFDPDDIARAFAAYGDGSDFVPQGPPVLLLDPSAGGDGWCWGLGYMATRKAKGDPRLTREIPDPSDPTKTILQVVRDEGGRPLQNPAYVPASETSILVVRRVAAHYGRFSPENPTSALVAKLVAGTRAEGGYVAVSDQFEQGSLAAWFYAWGFEFHAFNVNVKTKADAYVQLQRAFREGRVALEPHDGLRRELLLAEENVTLGGTTKFGGKKAHDFVSLLVVAALHDLNGGFRGSILEAPRRGVITGDESTRGGDRFGSTPRLPEGCI